MIHHSMSHTSRSELLVLFTLIVSFYCVNGNDDGFCSIDKPSCSSESNLKNIYQNALAEWSHDVCDERNCFDSQIDRDLSFWSSTGISKQLLDSAKPYGILYQCINGKWYRDVNCLFPSRCEGIEYFLKQINTSSSDIELVVNVRDWPQIHSSRHRSSIPPVFSFSKDHSYLDILYPAWAFWAGGPAIETFPTGIGKWDELSNKIASHAGEWTHKKSQIFFRGSRTSEERDPLILLSRSNFNIIDARYTKNQAWRSIKDTLNEEPAPIVTFEEHCKYKYLINVRGVAASFRFKHLFLCKSVVFNVESSQIEFFYHALKPWIHYVPIKHDLSDLMDKFHFLEENPMIAQEIATRGYQFIRQSLTNEHVTAYWEKLVSRYSQLLKYQVTHQSGLISI